MYYLYKSSKKAEVPSFDYSFKSFNDFYEMAKVLDVSINGSYQVRVKTDSYKQVRDFLNAQEQFNRLVVYIEVNESLLEYVQLMHPGVSLLTSKSNFEIFKSLIPKYDILFDKGCVEILYFAIGHSYGEMEDALVQIKTSYPDKQLITEDDISKIFVIDKLVYPRTVCIMFLRLDRGRWSRLQKSIDYFGNDIVLYSIRKNVRSFYKDKSMYLKTGVGSNLIKTMPFGNIISLMRCMDYERNGFKDIKTILSLYEKGESINDFMEERTCTSPYEKHHDA